MSIGHQLLNVPFDEMISSLGTAIAQAQYQLDQNSIEILRIMGEDNTVSLPFVSVSYDDKADTSGNALTISDNEIATSMIGAGFQPTFYQFAETIIEVKVAISMSYESSYERTYGKEQEIKDTRAKKRPVTTTTTVDATYANKYNYSAEGSSLLRTRLVPVPPNPMISQVIEMRNQAMEKFFEIEMKKCETEIEEATKKLEAAEAAKAKSV